MQNRFIFESLKIYPPKSSQFREEVPRFGTDFYYLIFWCVLKLLIHVLLSRSWLFKELRYTHNRSWFKKLHLKVIYAFPLTSNYQAFDKSTSRICSAGNIFHLIRNYSNFDYRIIKVLTAWGTRKSLIRDHVFHWRSLWRKRLY